MFRWDIQQNILNPASTRDLPFICQATCREEVVGVKQKQAEVLVADSGAHWFAITILCLEAVVFLAIELLKYMLRPRNDDTEETQHIYFVQINLYIHFNNNDEGEPETARQ